METPDVQAKAKQIGDQSGTFLELMGLSRLAGGVLLILVGLLVLLYPNFIQWTIGIGAIGLGILVLTQMEPSKTRT